MTNYKNVELIDDIRNDALILMSHDPNLSYLEAYNKAMKELIGDKNILSADLSEFDINISANLIKSKNNNKDLYLEQLKDMLSEDIDVSMFDKQQLRELSMGKKIGIDIKQIADNNYNPSQIKCLCIMLSMGKDIDEYKGNYTFDPLEVFKNIAKK